MGKGKEEGEGKGGEGLQPPTLIHGAATVYISMLLLAGKRVLIISSNEIKKNELQYRQMLETDRRLLLSVTNTQQQFLFKFCFFFNWPIFLEITPFYGSVQRPPKKNP